MNPQGQIEHRLLTCRLENCGSTAVIEDEKMGAVKWTAIEPQGEIVGIPGMGIKASKHRAYCPSHSFDDVDHIPENFNQVPPWGKPGTAGFPREDDDG